MMTPKIDYTDFKELRKIAMRYAASKGVHDIATQEDFAQEYMLATWLRKGGKSVSASFVIQFANFMRATYGRNDRFAVPTQRAKSYALRTMQSLDRFQTDDYFGGMLK